MVNHDQNHDGTKFQINISKAVGDIKYFYLIFNTMYLRETKELIHMETFVKLCGESDELKKILFCIIASQIHTEC